MDMSATQQRQERVGRAGADRARVARSKQDRRRVDRGLPGHGGPVRGGPGGAGPESVGPDRGGPERVRQDRLVADGPPPAVPDGPLMTLARARDALGLDYDEFDLAVQIGEVPTVACGSRSWKVRSDEVDRLVAEDGHPLPLLDRIRLVGSAEAAKELGVGRERFVRLARVGHIRPVRWYVNRYHALVWMYLARDLPVLAEHCPALLSGPLPEGLRAAVADGEDERARGWRSRRVAQLVRDTYDAWDEAAVWSALLGPELVDSALPDPYERAYLRKLRAALPPGRPGLATPEQIKVISTADHPDEIALALVALADALGRARNCGRHRAGPSAPPRNSLRSLRHGPCHCPPRRRCFRARFRCRTSLPLRSGKARMARNAPVSTAPPAGPAGRFWRRRPAGPAGAAAAAGAQKPVSGCG